MESKLKNVFLQQNSIYSINIEMHSKTKSKN